MPRLEGFTNTRVCEQRHQDQCYLEQDVIRTKVFKVNVFFVKSYVF